ncbi:glycosyltransferase family 2 protein [Brevibacillus sp. SYSU BS000544]|uniref:glycosyltransferase family 2 protein n=1 Tax=Brevibacillus sp. SYSU BS000544 TaxID=3416443 RepID=UPI003CE46A5B
MRRQLKNRRNRECHISDDIPISVIIPARNEEKTIRRVIAEAKRINRKTEVIVVCNGNTDRTAGIANKAGAKVISYAESLGHDVGRAIGASHANGEVLLFVDADFVIPTWILRKYCLDVINGWDVVLNSYSGIVTKSYMDLVTEAKRVLNHLAGRPDLIGSSFTTVPHACSKKAVEIIGYENLAIPPLAQVQAIVSGLKIKRGHLIYTPYVNRKRKRPRNSVIHLVLGDHVEAIRSIIQARGIRGGYDGPGGENESNET